MPPDPHSQLFMIKREILSNRYTGPRYLHAGIYMTGVVPMDMMWNVLPNASASRGTAMMCTWLGIR